MSLDYSWSLDPIFPAAIFDDLEFGPLLEKVGLAANMRGNYVAAFHSRETAVALLQAPEEVLDAMIGAGVSLAPHTALQDGDQTGGRLDFLREQFADIVARQKAGELDDENAKLEVFSAHMFLARHVIRRVAQDEETGKLRPDADLLAAVKDIEVPAFDLEAATAALEDGPTPALPARPEAAPAAEGPEGITLTAVVLLDDVAACATTRERVEAIPGLLEGFTVRDLSPGSFTAERGDTMLVAMAMDAPFPAGDLKTACDGNVLAPGVWEIASGTKAHVHLQLMRKTSDAPTREDAMLLGRIAAAGGGVAVLWGCSGGVVPSSIFNQTIAESAESGNWPILAMIQMLPYEHEGRRGAALMGLAPFVGHELALAAGPEGNLQHVAGRLLGLAGWVLETRPHFADGDTMGVEGSNGAQLRIHELISGRGVPTFELRPYDGPPASHTPEERAAEMAAAEAAPKAASLAPAPKKPFWKFWTK